MFANHRQIPVFSPTRSVVNGGLLIIEAHNPYDRPLFLEKGKYVGRSESAASGACKFIGSINAIDPSDSDATSFIENDTVRQRVGFDTDKEAHDAIDKIERPSPLSPSQWDLFKSQSLHTYADIMTWRVKDPDEAAKIVGEHRIDLIPDAKPHNMRPYPATQAGKEAIRAEVSKLRDNGVTGPSLSEWSSPPIIQKKPDGSWRFIVDLRHLNAKTIKDCYPLPRINETLDALRRAKFITTVDLQSGYFQIPIHKDHRKYTAFAYDGGFDEFKFMAQGLCNAPATFQRIMDKILAGYKYSFCFVYLDDIVIFSESFDDHINHVKKVFDRLRQYELSISLKKCQFARDQVKFLGHIIKNGTISPDPNTVASIKDLSPPTGTSQLRSYLGLLNYYRTFIPRFAHIAAPLHKLLSNKSHYVWDNDCQKAFEVLNHSLISYPILQCSDPNRPFIIHTDASDYAIGAVLAQKDDDGKEHVVAYLSRSLSNHETKYTTTEKECLAVLWSIKKWHYYIADKSFSVFTDHAALKWLMSLKIAPNQRLARWILAFQSYDYVVHHRPGVTHQNADALSRLTTSSSGDSVVAHDIDARLEIIASISSFDDPSNSAQLRDAQQNDADLKFIYSVLMKLAPEAHPRATKLQKMIDRHGYVIENDLVCKQNPSSSLEKPKLVPVIPSSMINDVLDAAHKNDLSAHCGERVMYYNIRQRCYWPHLSKDVANYVRRCHQCQLSKAKPSLTIPSLPLPIPSRPFEIVGMDAMAMPTTSSGNNTLIVFTDYLTRWAEAVAVRAKKAGDCTAEQVAQALLDVIISRHGLPLSILSDKGKAFCDGAVSKLLDYLCINKLQTSPYHPQCNGLTERFNRTFTTMLLQFGDSGLADAREWDERLPLLLFAYRTHFNRNSKKSAFYLLYGRDPVVPINAAIGFVEPRFNSREAYVREITKSMPVIWKFVTENLEEQAKAVHRRNEQLLKDRQLQLYSVGDKVYSYIHESDGKKVAYKVKPRWKGPYEVTKVISIATYEISDGKNSFISWSGHLRPARDLQDDAGRPLTPFSISLNEPDHLDD